MAQVKQSKASTGVEDLKQNAVLAAGGVLWRPSTANETEVEVAVIHRPRYDDWSLPKGKLNPGEMVLEGALREVFEETGYRATVGRPLGEVQYIKDDRPKIVRYWALLAEGGVFTPGREVDELRWLPMDDARDLLTQERDRDLLDRFAAGPIYTNSVLLVRHGSAGSRSGWDGDDLGRPLDNVGRRQADALVWLLTRFDVREIISAIPVRCRQTVEPLATAVGLLVREEPVLGEHHYYGAEAEAMDLLRLKGTEGAGTVLCSQGGVIPDIVERFAARDRCPIEGPISSKKGSVWSLTFSDGRLHSAEYFHPLG